MMYILHIYTSLLRMMDGIVVVVATFACIFLWKLILCCYINPLKTLNELTSNGFRGPKPSFPLGNLKEMMKLGEERETLDRKPRTFIPPIEHDIYQSSLPYFADWRIADWRKSYGKVFVYWMGTKPFLYVADPGFLKQMSSKVSVKEWGKAAVLKSDRDGLFGNFALNVIEESNWVRHKHIINRALSSTNMKLKMNVMIECTKKLINEWKILVNTSNSGSMEIEIHKATVSLVNKITAGTHLGLGSGGKALQEKIRALEIALYKDLYKRYIGVPFSQLICLKRTLEKRRLGKEINQIFLSFIDTRRQLIGNESKQDLLGVLLDDSEANLTQREILDECKVFFFAGTAAMPPLITWTLMLLAVNPKWQKELRAEIKDVVGDKEIDSAMLIGLKKMGWVMNEVLRLYPSDLNGQRQALTDIQVGQTVIPKGTNILIDILGMHHDRTLWGEDVHDFKPKRFEKDPLYGGCTHKMSYLPFGFGGRLCAGKNYSTMEYKVVLSLMLPRFSFSLSPAYRHSPTSAFSFEPENGMPLIVQHLGTY